MKKNSHSLYSCKGFFYILTEETAFTKSNNNKFTCFNKKCFAGNSLEYHNGMKFSTRDQDNDLYEDGENL